MGVLSKTVNIQLRTDQYLRHVRAYRKISSEGNRPLARQMKYVDVITW
jgi:hypothetical protein